MTIKEKKLNLREIRDIARKMSRARLQEITLNYPHGSVRLRYDHLPPLVPEHSPAYPDPAPPGEPGLLPVCAPIPGRLMLCHPDNNEPCVGLSQQVKKDDLVALVQAGPLYLPVLSPADGMLECFMADAGSIVEYGSEIAQLKPVT